ALAIGVKAKCLPPDELAWRHSQLGSDYRQLKMPKEAEAHYRQGLEFKMQVVDDLSKKAPKDEKAAANLNSAKLWVGVTWRNLSWVCLKQKKNPEALEAAQNYLKFVEHSPQDTKLAIQNLAEIQEMIDPKQAINTYKKEYDLALAENKGEMDYRCVL